MSDEILYFLSVAKWGCQGKKMIILNVSRI